MPVPTSLAVEFTPAELNDMKNAAKLINDLIKSKIDMNLSDAERRSLSKVGDQRQPYVSIAIGVYANNFPHLNGQAVPLPDAQKDIAVYGELIELVALSQQAFERTIELQMVAGHYAFEFMRDQYFNAERYKDSASVEGAQVVYDGLKACFEGQGPQNPPAPTP